MIKAMFLSWLVFLTLIMTLWVRIYFMSDVEHMEIMEGNTRPEIVFHAVAMITSFFVSVVITTMTIIMY